MVNPQRIRQIKSGPLRSGPVVYWMSRDQRVQDNWALLFAQESALTNKSALIIIFCLTPQFLNASLRQYAFMLRGLQELKRDCDKKNIFFVLLLGDPATEVLGFVKKHHASALVCDFDPLRIKRLWKEHVAMSINLPFFEVDAHNIIPCWQASDKQEFGAYTIRPKIHKKLSAFLEDFPRLKKHPIASSVHGKDLDIEALCKTLKVNTSIGEVDWIVPGERAAGRSVKDFITKKLPRYAEQRNDPVLNGQSNLSPYLHFGQLSSQRVALSVLSAPTDQSVKDAFLEELIVRKELSDNFCYYCPSYDTVACAPSWAKKTLTEHASDPREYNYDLRSLEQSQTHDVLWNAAQQELVITGKMHGFMRMYWAKKILEWTIDPGQAFDLAVRLNDAYELDGRDPNGYAGIAWSVAGVHDRAWGERAIFGKVRYMSYHGCKNKFNIHAYIAKHQLKKG